MAERINVNLSNSELTAVVEEHAARNELLVAELHSRGVDSKTPRSVELHFWAPDQRSAALLGKALYDRGYLLLSLNRASEASAGLTWNVEAGITLSVERIVDRELTRELVELAANYSCQYDGWGTLC